MSKKAIANASSLETHAGFWLRFVSNHVSARFQAQIEEQDISISEWVAMRTLFDRDETSNAVLIKALGMTKGAASKIVSRLEAKGLAVRQLVEGSGREQTLSLTDAGSALVPRLAAIADENDEHFFGHMSQRQRSDLMRLLSGLVAHHQLHELPIS